MPEIFSLAAAIAEAQKRRFEFEIGDGKIRSMKHLSDIDPEFLGDGIEVDVKTIVRLLRDAMGDAAFEELRTELLAAGAGAEALGELGKAWLAFCGVDLGKLQDSPPSSESTAKPSTRPSKRTTGSRSGTSSRGGSRSAGASSSSSSSPLGLPSA